MIGVIDMQRMRHLNLFSKITRISTKKSFKYNETIFYCVPGKLVSKAIGKGAINVKKIHEILNKKIKVIPSPNGIEDIKTFIQHIVEPVSFKNVVVGDIEVVLHAGSQSKAALIGRNRRRLLEMQQIVKDFFKKEFRVA